MKRKTLLIDADDTLWENNVFFEKLIEDLKLKAELKRRFTGAGVSHVDVERAANRLKIIIYTSRPGIIIGRKGSEIDKLKGDISSRTGREVLVSIQEIHKPELNAQLQAEKIAAQLEKRIAFRRAMRKAVEESLRFGAQGIKVKVSGRLNGAEIARSLAVHHISIASVMQHEALDDQQGSTVPLVIMTHSAPTGNFTAAIAALDALDCIAAPTVFFPIGE